MPESNRPLKVFLSYASQDKSLVRELSRRLVGEGWIDTWQDEKNLLPGQDWRVKIEEAVEEADIVIIVLSQNSVSKEGHVQKELRYAREIALEKPEEAIFLIPLRLDECEVPRGLRFYQWVDYFGERKNNGYDALVKSLKLRYEQKLKLEELERARLEKARLEAEQEAAEELVRQKAAKEKAEYEADEKVAREKAEKAAAEKARLEAEELAKEKNAKEKAEREATEKVAREKAEKEAAEKAQLEAEELARQKAAKEKAEREAAEKARLETEELEKQKAVKEKAKHDSDEKATREKVKPVQKPEIKKLQGNSNVVYWIVGIFVILLVIGLSSLNGTPSTPVPTSTQASLPQSSSSSVSTQKSAPSNTFTKIASTSTPLPTNTPKPWSTEITDDKGAKMALVPAGKFKMGNNSYPDEMPIHESEKPVHEVYLDTYYMDVYEVTNAAYKMCVDNGVCSPPSITNSNARVTYYGNSRFDNYPVIYVDWNMANLYCKWRGSRLPTEAEWEKAARGIDGRIYPWGNDDVTCALANRDSCNGDTAAVGKYEDGKSPYGMYDMIGNVSEWVSSLYMSYPYDPSDGREETSSSAQRVWRGGSWDYRYDPLPSSTSRRGASPDSAVFSVGFRCAKSAP